MTPATWGYPATPPPPVVKTGEMVYRCSGTSFTHEGAS